MEGDARRPATRPRDCQRVRKRVARCGHGRWRRGHDLRTATVAGYRHSAFAGIPTFSGRGDRRHFGPLASKRRQDTGGRRGKPGRSMTDYKTTFTVVSYNRRDQVKDLLQSVLAGDKVPDELIVVDNASSDDTVEMLAREFPQVRVIANRENLMGSKAVNQGIAAASGDFVFASADDNVVDP